MRAWTMQEQQHQRATVEAAAPRQQAPRDCPVQVSAASTIGVLVAVAVRAMKKVARSLLQRQGCMNVLDDIGQEGGLAGRKHKLVRDEFGQELAAGPVAPFGSRRHQRVQQPLTQGPQGVLDPQRVAAPRANQARTTTQVHRHRSTTNRVSVHAQQEDTALVTQRIQRAHLGETQKRHRTCE